MFCFRPYLLKLKLNQTINGYLSIYLYLSLNTLFIQIVSEKGDDYKRLGWRREYLKHIGDLRGFIFGGNYGVRLSRGREWSNRYFGNY